jgi:hypothetical protein
MSADQDKSIIGRGADAARTRTDDGSDIAEQLNATTSEDAGGTVSGTGDADENDDAEDELEILFEPEMPGETLH